MFRLHPTTRAAALFILLLSFSVLLAACAGSNSSTANAIQPDGSRIAKGKVTEITDTMVTVKPPRGEAVQVRFTPATSYNGVAAGRIKKGQALEIRYKTEGTENTAISVTVIKEGSC